MMQTQKTKLVLTERFISIESVQLTLQISVWGNSRFSRFSLVLPFREGLSPALGRSGFAAQPHASCAVMFGNGAICMECSPAYPGFHVKANGKRCATVVLNSFHRQIIPAV